MATPLFTGVYTALVTPFHDDGSLDLDSYKKLVRAQVAAGLHGLVPCGTTGEASTLSVEEHVAVVTACRDEARATGKPIKIVAGAGSNDTKKAVEMHKRVTELGVDGALHVTPWYNKPTQEGLYRHFRAIADASPLPIVLYNVPGRTGVDMLPDTIARLAKDASNIVAVKEATGSIQRAQQIVNKLHGVRDDFSILSGDDGFILGLLSIGGHGVISVTSHLCAKDLVEMMAAFHAGDHTRAQALSRKTSPLADALFFRSNPIPVKTALALQGMMKANFRSPLCPLLEDELAQLKKLLAEAGWA
jgi:4-hydroxy-tetrahydrodipicolinate synthase